MYVGTMERYFIPLYLLKSDISHQLEVTKASLVVVSTEQWGPCWRCFPHRLPPLQAQQAGWPASPSAARCRWPPVRPRRLAPPTSGGAQRTSDRRPGLPRPPPPGRSLAPAGREKDQGLIVRLCGGVITRQYAALSVYLMLWCVCEYCRLKVMMRWWW